MTYTKYNTEDYTPEVTSSAYAAVKLAKDTDLCYFRTDILEAAMQEADNRVFLAEMSDDYATTRKERAQVHADAHLAFEELAARAEWGAKLAADAELSARC